MTNPINYNYLLDPYNFLTLPELDARAELQLDGRYKLTYYFVEEATDLYGSYLADDDIVENFYSLTNSQEAAFHEILNPESSFAASFSNVAKIDFEETVAGADMQIMQNSVLSDFININDIAKFVSYEEDGGTNKALDITTHAFDVALSFPGETRHFVEPIAIELERALGPHAYFYDNNYRAQLARPSLDVLLQDLYRNRSKLVAIFLSSDYQRKEWCGVEFRAIKEILMGQDHRKIMFIRMDDGAVDGVFKTDGYIDGRKFSASEIAAFIQERVRLAG